MHFIHHKNLWLPKEAVTDLSLLGAGGHSAAAPGGHFFEDYGSVVLCADINTATKYTDAGVTAVSSTGDTLQRVMNEVGGGYIEATTAQGTAEQPTAFGSKWVLNNNAAGLYALDSARSALSAGTWCLVFRKTDGTTEAATGTFFIQMATGTSNARARIRTQSGDEFVEWMRDQGGDHWNLDKTANWQTGAPVTVLIMRWASSSSADFHYRIDGGTNQGAFNLDPDDVLTTATAFELTGDQFQFGAYALYDEDIGATEAGNLLTDAIARWT